MTKFSTVAHLESISSEERKGNHNQAEEISQSSEDRCSMSDAETGIKSPARIPLEFSNEKSKFAVKKLIRSFRKSKNPDLPASASMSREQALQILQDPRTSRKFKKTSSHSDIRDGYVDITPYCGKTSSREATTSSGGPALSPNHPQMLNVPPLDEVLKSVGGPPRVKNSFYSTDTVRSPTSPCDNLSFDGLSANRVTTASLKHRHISGQRPINQNIASDFRRQHSQQERVQCLTSPTDSGICDASVDGSNSTSGSDDSFGSRQNIVHTKPAEQEKTKSSERPAKRRKFLSIMIPKELPKVNGVRQLSAAESKEMDDALELVNRFSRLSSSQEGPLRTPGAASTSKESLSSGVESSKSKKFAFKRKPPHEIRKSHMEEFNNTIASSPNGSVTPEGQQAYNSLIAHNRFTGSPARSPAYLSSARETKFDFPRRMRSSMSESDRSCMTVQDYRRRLRNDRLSLQTNSLSLNRHHTQQNCDMRRAHNSAEIIDGPSVRQVDFISQGEDDNSATTLTSETTTYSTSSASSTVTPTNTSQDTIRYSTNNSHDCINDYLQCVEQDNCLEILETVEGICRLNEIEIDGMDPGEYSDASEQSAETLRHRSVPEGCESNNIELHVDEMTDLTVSPSNNHGNTKSYNSMHPNITEYCPITSGTINELTLPCSRFGSDKLMAAPPLPPRAPLHKSTINNPLPRRKFPLASDPLPSESLRVGSEMTLPSYRKTPARQTSCHVVGHARNQYSMTLGARGTPRLNSTASSASSSSSGSEQMNCSMESGDDVFNSPDHLYANKSQLGAELTMLSHASPTACVRHKGCLVNRGNVKDVKVSACDLGMNDKGDLFWAKKVLFNIPQETIQNMRKESSSSSAAEGLQGKYETSDDASYEDLMEFALEVERRRNVNGDSEICDEIRLMRTVLSKEVSVDDCMAALDETCWDIYTAIKLIKLKQLLSIGLADKQLCKQALMTCSWNTEEAAMYLLAHPNQRPTPDLLSVS